MSIKSYKLTKSNITSGLQCKKKLWYDVHDPLKSSKSTFERGERFNEVVRKHYTSIYGKELNLTGVWDDLVNKTLLIKNMIFGGKMYKFGYSTTFDLCLKKFYQ